MMFVYLCVGCSVVWFKGGDLFVFGCGGEELIVFGVVGFLVEVVSGIIVGIVVLVVFGILVMYCGDV